VLGELFKTNSRDLPADIAKPPTTPNVLPLRSWPTDFCQPPFLIELFS
jgi:hypothetical protein